jgi:hypothetical protein
MTHRCVVDGLNFDFEDGWLITKYDDWQFYRRQFGRMRNGIKAIDLLVCAPNRIVYLVEVRDHRAHIRTKPSELSDEIMAKVFDTLAAMLPAKINGRDGNERAVAARVLSANSLKVILHLEQPVQDSKLFRRAIDPADVQMKLRQRLKPIDPHPKVCEMGRMYDLSWSVT